MVRGRWLGHGSDAGSLCENTELYTAKSGAAFGRSNYLGRNVARGRGSVGHADEAANFGRDAHADGVAFLVPGADRAVAAGRDKPVELDCESPHLAILRQH